MITINFEPEKRLYWNMVRYKFRPLMDAVQTIAFLGVIIAIIHAASVENNRF
jgi:hypothetical protein